MFMIELCRRTANYTVALSQLTSKDNVAKLTRQK
jgi:hypothetical protein